MENREGDNVSAESGRDAIILHPEVVKQRQDVYNSLTDLYGIDVFSTKFQDIVAEVLRERRQKEEEIGETVFAQDMLRQQEADRQIEEQLFLGQKQNILSPEYTRGSESWSFMHTGIVLIAVLAVAALYIFIFQDRKVRKK